MATSRTPASDCGGPTIIPSRFRDLLDLALIVSTDRATQDEFKGTCPLARGPVRGREGCFKFYTDAVLPVMCSG